MTTSSSKKRKAEDFDDLLPEDCWEFVLSKLLKIDNVDDRNRYIKQTLSFVSKRFLSTSGCLVYSLTILNPSVSLTRIFHRFPYLTSLDFSSFRGDDLNSLLCRVSCSCSLSYLTSLNLSNHPMFPALGLQKLVKKTQLSLTSLTCSNIGSPLNHTDITFIADSFPLLEYFDISFPKGRMSSYDYDCCNNALKILTQKLSKLRKVNLSGNFYVNDSLFFELCSNCKLLDEVVMLECPLLTHAGIASAIYERPSLSSFSVSNFMEARESKNVTSYFIDSLVSLKRLTHLDLSFSCVTDDILISVASEDLPLRNLVLQDCSEYTYFGISYLLSKCRFVQHLDLQNAKFLNDDDNSSMLYPYLRDLVSINVSGCNMLTNITLFALPRSCPLLSDIKMESTSIGIGPLGEPFVYHQVKSLHLANNSQLLNINIDIFAFMFPNMQLLDLNSCPGISKDIGHVLKRWGDIGHLELPFYPQKKLPWINFNTTKLEVLNLSKSKIDDEVLHLISKFCPQLQQLDVENCRDITEDGVRLVVENCEHLREINLQHCRKVSANIVDRMILLRPSLKIIAPPYFHPCLGLTDLEKGLLYVQNLVH